MQSKIRLSDNQFDYIRMWFALRASWLILLQGDESGIDKLQWNRLPEVGYARSSPYWPSWMGLLAKKTHAGDVPLFHFADRNVPRGFVALLERFYKASIR